MWVSSLLLGLGHDLETNKFTEVEEVGGHGVITLIGLGMVGGVAVLVVTAVVDIKVNNVLDSTRVFQLTSL